MAQKKSLLVVDGYNVMLATPRYEALLDEHGSSTQETAAERAYHLNTDPFYRARLALISDVATFAQGTYEAVIVFDGKGNVNDERPERTHAGVQLVFPRLGSPQIASSSAWSRTRERLVARYFWSRRTGTSAPRLALAPARSRALQAHHWSTRFPKQITLSKRCVAIRSVRA